MRFYKKNDFFFFLIIAFVTTLIVTNRISNNLVEQALLRENVGFEKLCRSNFKC